jgi:murein DD-endopeptidase MepM/ murein hydrolase activator NlpD
VSLALALAAVSLVVLIAHGPGRPHAASAGPERPASAEGDGAGASAGGGVTAAAGAERPPTAAFARVGHLLLYLPGRDVAGVGFHEAAVSQALAMTPLGRCTRDANRARMRCPARAAGPAYVILPTRHRAAGPTTAADVAMAAGAVVRSPVTGVVVDRRWYWLYGVSRDERLVIRPDDAPGLLVVLIHVTDLRVGKGDRVTAGVTPIASPRVIPFKSDINRYVGPDIPHVHIEVKHRGAPGHPASE